MEEGQHEHEPKTSCTEVPEAHSWEPVTLLQPTWCTLPSCSALIGIYGGVKCKNCISVVHKTCVAAYDFEVLCHPESGTHNFIEKTFRHVVHCNHCEKVLWGLSNQGKLCIHCKGVVHHECEPHIAHECYSGRWIKSTPPHKCENCKNGKCAVQLLRDEVREILEQNAPEIVKNAEENNLSVDNAINGAIRLLSLSGEVPKEESEEPTTTTTTTAPTTEPYLTVPSTTARPARPSFLPAPKSEIMEVQTETLTMPNEHKHRSSNSDESKLISAEISPQQTKSTSQKTREFSEKVKAAFRPKEAEPKDPLFGCQDPVSCTCDCNIGSSHDVAQKVFAIAGGIGLFAGSIAVSILTAGVGAAVAISAGLIGGVGFSSAIHGGAAAIRGNKINARDFGLDVGIGAATGLVSGGIGLGIASAAGAGIAAATSTGHAISHAGQVGIQSTVKIATGVASSTTGKLVSDGIDISAGRKEQTDLGQNIGVSIITGSTGAILSVAGEATSKVAEHVAAKLAIKGAQVIATETINSSTKSGLTGSNKETDDELLVLTQIAWKILDVPQRLLAKAKRAGDEESGSEEEKEKKEPLLDEKQPLSTSENNQESDQSSVPRPARPQSPPAPLNPLLVSTTTSNYDDHTDDTPQ